MSSEQNLDKNESAKRHDALALAIELYKGNFSKKIEAEKSDIEQLFVQADWNLKYINNESIDYAEMVAPADAKRLQNNKLRSYKFR